MLQIVSIKPSNIISTSGEMNIYDWYNAHGSYEDLAPGRTMFGERDIYLGY